MKIGLDVSGGDFAPKVNLLGAIHAKSLLPEDVKIVLFGRQEEIERELDALDFKTSIFEVVDSPEVISMDDHPARVFSKKPNASISLAFDQLSEGKIDAFASTGNTGAMLVGSIYKINTIPGVIRPCITATIPCANGKKISAFGRGFECGLSRRRPLSIRGIRSALCGTHIRNTFTKSGLAKYW